MNVRTVQHSMLKRAGLFGNTMVGRWITDTMGPHTFVSDALGASALYMIDHQAQTQLGWQPPKGYTKEELAAQAAAQKRINDRIDRGLAAAQQRLAAGKGVTQVAQKPRQPARVRTARMAAPVQKPTASTQTVKPGKV